MPTLRRSAASTLPLLFALLMTSRAHATSGLETLGSPDGTNPFTARVSDDGPFAAFFNPALLALAEPSVRAYFVVVDERFQLDMLPRPQGVDVSSAIYTARRLEAGGKTAALIQRPLPTSELRTPRGTAPQGDTRFLVGLGTVARIIPERLHIGFLAFVPANKLQRQASHFSDHREQYFSNSPQFELYGDRSEVANLVAGIGGRIFPWLAVGAGVTLTLATDAESQVFVRDASEQENVDIRGDFGVKTKVVPHVGLAVDPVRRLRVVATLHMPYQNEITGRNDVQLWNYSYPAGQSSIEQRFNLRSFDMPLRVALGTRVALIDRASTKVDVSVQATYTKWSDYQDRSGESPLDAWSDSFSVAGGTTFTLRDRKFGLDFLYAPTPVPDQTGRTNYVDNTRIGWALGYQERFRVFGKQLHAGLSVQLQRLIPRTSIKSQNAAHPVIDEFPDSVDARTNKPIPESAGLQTNNPGYPGYSSRGWIVAGGLSLSMEL